MTTRGGFSVEQMYSGRYKTDRFEDLGNIGDLGETYTPCDHATSELHPVYASSTYQRLDYWRTEFGQTTAYLIGAEAEHRLLEVGISNGPCNSK